MANERRWRLAILALAALALAPAAAFAQSAIAGVVTDTTGAVLPGVTAEARSPALIEQVKTALTDAQGRYRIVDLRPGTYSVTFTLPGFNTVLRDGITLESNFIANIDIQLRVGAIEETVTVTGAAPVVDVQSTQRREVMGRQVMDALPSGRSQRSIARTLPAITMSGTDLGGTDANAVAGLGAYGSTQESVSIDGLKVDGGRSSGAGVIIYLNDAAAEEYVYQLNGGAAETQTGGVQINVIPKTGGNRFAGDAGAFFANNAMQSQNISDEQLAQLSQGLQAAPGLDEVYDYHASLGGPIFKDRLWFFNSYRWWAAKVRTGLLHDGKIQPAGEPLLDAALLYAIPLRVTAQLNQKNKLTAYYEWSIKKQPWRGAEGRMTAPEATRFYNRRLGYVAQGKWTYTPMTKILVEAGWSATLNGQEEHYQDSVQRPSAALPYGTIPKLDVVTGLLTNAAITEFYTPMYQHVTSASMSYVTGAHAFKTGVQVNGGTYNEFTSANGDIAQLYRSGVPFAVRVLATPSASLNNLDMDLGLYAQDTWRLKRLTLNPGVRFDKMVGSIPDQSMPAGRFLPARSFAAIKDVPNWTDFSPRFGGAFDLLGDGKMALKGSVGRYVATDFVSRQVAYNPALSGLGGTAFEQRNWTDLNGDDVAQDNEIGPSPNPGFGTRVTNSPGPDLKRGYEVLYNLSFDRELRRDVGVSFAYNRRDTKNLIWTDNTAYAPGDYELFTVPDPTGNGLTLPIYQVIPGRVRPAVNVDLNSSENSRVYNGFDFIVHGRLANGAFVQGGTSTGRIVANSCEVENPNSLRFCDESQYGVPFQTAFKLSGSYPLPWLGFRVGLVFQSLPGAQQIVNYTVTRAEAPRLSTASSVVVRLNEPGSQYLARLNQLDLSLGGTIPVGKTRVKPQIDLFNLMNSNPVLTVSTGYPLQGRALTIQQGRLLRLGIRMDF